MSGEDRLVPPTTNQPLNPNVSYTAAPEVGLASAETSVYVRFLPQSGSDCQAGFGSYGAQPLPAPAHADSDQPRSLPSLCRYVPPTAMTYCEAAGYVRKLL